MLAFVVPVIGVGLRIAFCGIDDEGTLPLGKLAVRQDVDTLVADQPYLETTGSGNAMRVRRKGAAPARKTTGKAPAKGQDTPTVKQTVKRTARKAAAKATNKS